MGLRRPIRNFIDKYFGKKVSNTLPRYASETSKVRHLVENFCVGFGCDIGHGGDKIKKENCIGIDLPNPYANTGDDPVNISTDVINEGIPVEDNSYDYVYSSHLIEDFHDTAKGLREFSRILKDKGNLILVFPDQKKYEEECLKTNQPLNIHHVHQNMGLQFMLDKLASLRNEGLHYNLVYSSDCEIDYNVILVLQVVKTE